MFLDNDIQLQNIIIWLLYIVELQVYWLIGIIYNISTPPKQTNKTKFHSSVPKPYFT